MGTTYWPDGERADSVSEGRFTWYGGRTVPVGNCCPIGGSVGPMPPWYRLTGGCGRYAGACGRYAGACGRYAAGACCANDSWDCGTNDWACGTNDGAGAWGTYGACGTYCGVAVCTNCGGKWMTGGSGSGEATWNGTPATTAGDPASAREPYCWLLTPSAVCPPAVWYPSPLPYWPCWPTAFVFTVESWNPPPYALPSPSLNLWKRAENRPFSGAKTIPRKTWALPVWVRLKKLVI